MRDQQPSPAKAELNAPTRIGSSEIVRRRLEIKNKIKRLTQLLRECESEIKRERRRAKYWPEDGQRIRFSRITRFGKQWFEGIFCKQGMAHIVTDNGENLRFINRGWEPSNNHICDP